MKKLYLFLLAVCLSVGTISAQMLPYVSDDENSVGGRNNAPQETRDVHFEWEGSIGTYMLYLGSSSSLSALMYINCIELSKSDGTEMRLSFSYPSATGEADYGDLTATPPGTYSVATKQSQMSAQYKIFACGELTYYYISSGTYAGYYSNVVTEELDGTQENIYTTGLINSEIAYQNETSGYKFTGGNVTVEYGRHGLPFVYSSNLKAGGNTYNLTIGDSRNLTTVYTSAETLFNADDMTVTLSGYNGTDNRMSFTFNVSSFDAVTGLPAGTYTVGTDVSGIVYDLDGFTTWELSRGTATISYDSEGVMSMTVSSLYGLSDEIEYSLNLSLSDIVPVNKVCQDLVPFTFSDFVSSSCISEGTNTVAYHMGWFRDGDNSKRPGLQLSFCFPKSGIRYVDGKVVPPDGTYYFHPGIHKLTVAYDSNGNGSVVEVTLVKNYTVSAYRWLLWDTNQYDRIQAYSSYLDESNTRYYLNSGFVTVSTQSDGVHIVVDANGGTDPSGDMDTPFKFVVQTNPIGYKLDVSQVVGQGSVTKSPDDCFYQEGTQVILTPTPEDKWTFSGWTGDCAELIEDNGDGTFTFTVPAYDCSVVANFEEGASFDVVFKNYDETVLQSGQVKEDETPVYTGETPVKPQDNYFTYTFSGWSNGTDTYGAEETLPAVKEDVTYTAVFTSEQRLFTVHFKNPDSDGDLQTSYLAFETTPVFEGTPTREKDGDEYNWYEFTFTGWADSEGTIYKAGTELPAVTQDTVYTAQYSKALYIILQENMDADYYTSFSDKYNGEKAASATLERQFGQGKWATLCLPFNVPTALLTNLKMMNRVYEFRYTQGSEAEGLTLYFAQAKKLEAGKGYIVNANATLAQKESFLFPGVTINTEADINSGFDLTNLEGYNSQGSIYLVGTLRTGVVMGSETGNTYMGLKDNKIYAPNSQTGTKLRAYRGIFRNAGNEQLPSRVRIVVEGEDGEQVNELEVINGSLEEVATPKKYIRNGILYIERNGMQFDAQGQRLD